MKLAMLSLRLPTTGLKREGGKRVANGLTAHRHHVTHNPISQIAKYRAAA